MRITKFFLIQATLLCALAGTTAARADQNASYPFDTSGQLLTEALNHYAQTTNQSIIFTEDLVVGRKANVLKGSYTADTALAELLKGTGLVAVRNSAGALQIRRAEDMKSSMETVPDAELRLAQSESDPKSSSSESVSSQTDESSSKATSEIVVTGTHIRGAQNNTIPVIVLDREYIDSTGLSTTTRLMESLPQNYSLANQSQASARGVSGAPFQGSGVNLRGIGEGTTLVLINGRRPAPGFGSAAADISALPLSAIERVEVLTDGASAIYGSDAVGGVVNFILRSDFDGVETHLQSGWADGLKEHRASQIVGTSWDSGNALLSLEYYDRDLLRTDQRDFVPDSVMINSLLPQDRNYSALFSAKQDLSRTVRVFTDVLHTQRDSYNEADSRQFLGSGGQDTDNAQTSATVGLEWALGTDWSVELSGGYALNKNDYVRTDLNGRYPVELPLEVYSARVKADGALLEIAGGKVRAAFGGDWRSEEYIPQSSSGKVEFDQTVRSLFAEAIVPLVGSGNARPGLQRLELSLAARYDDYSSFGSSTDPRIGLMWRPVEGMSLRGSFGTSYVAPKLADYDKRFNYGFTAFVPDPGLPGVPDSYLLYYAGATVEDFTAQSSRNWSFGMELMPESVKNLRLALNYFNIEYSNKLAIAADGDLFAVLGNPEIFAAVTVRNPSVAQVEAVVAEVAHDFTVFDGDFNIIPSEDFDPSTVDVIVDARLRNLSRVDSSGMDFAADYRIALPAGRLQLGLSATYFFNQTQAVTSTSPSFDIIDRITHPVDLRMRGSLGWSHRGWSTNVFVNYTDSYVDDRVDDGPSNPPLRVASHETIDANLSYDFSERFSSGWLSGVTLSVNAMNLFDADPPRTAVLDEVRDLGFDTANASPLGRLISVGIAKIW